MISFLNFLINYAKDNIILTIIGILTFYKFIYLIIGLFSRAKIYPETNIKNKYAIIIAAKNEEAVIGNLLNSLNSQTYDKDLLTIFVVADNCTDKTAEIARAHGAITYERTSKANFRKGYALEYLFNNIENDYKINSFGGFIFFDADNLVDKNFINEIHKAFVSKGNIVIGYRNIKNFETNYISKAYGIHFYRSIVSYHRPRESLNIGTHISGTGYIIDSKLLQNGWRYFGLTEDTELTLKMASKGYNVSFSEKAVFYDEQPNNLKIALRQRTRWTKGRLDAFIITLPKVIYNGIKNLSFTLYDLFFYSFPWPFYTLIKVFIYPLILGLIFKDVYNRSFWLSFLTVIGTMSAGVYLNNLVYGALAVIRERNNIPTTTYHKITAIFFYPLFNLINVLLAVRVIINPNIKWKKIHHSDKRTIEDIKITKKG